MVAVWIVEPGPLLALAVVLVVGVVSGVAARRCHLPSVTGQILAGVVLGPVLGVFETETVHAFQPITHFALGLMAVAVGSHLHLARLATARRRLAILIGFEAVLTPAIVFGAVFLLGARDWQTALLLGTIAVSTAPATILAIVKETRSRGVFVKTLVAAVALNNIACIVLFEAAHTATLLSFDPAGGGSAWLAPLREIGYALLLGGGIGFALVLGTRHVVRSDRLTTLSLIAILLTAGMAEQLGASPLLASLVLGIVLANLTPDKEEIGHEVFENFESAIFAVFFTLAGMELEFAHLGVAGALAGFVFAGRAVAKLASGTLSMSLAGATRRVRRNLGMALLPQAGLAVGLMLLVTEDPRFPEAMRELVLAVVLTVVTLNELVGPVLARIALARSGDLGKDRPRLIDFIHEEHIVTGFEAATVEGAIERLADLLVRMNDLSGQRDRILASAIERERQGSTCLGHGLAVPHADLEQGDSILGVMGISRKGLPFETPDGEPVHCMVLLATPPGQRDHRLEVLAAFATAILKDRGIEKQLYRAKSPAHAYELLHHEESEDFNHFLEE